MATDMPSSVKVGNSAQRSSGIENRAAKKQVSAGKAATPLPWKTLLGLGLILVELWLNTGVIWGVFMLLWAIMGINSGQTYILEILERKSHPILFWFTIHLWLLFAAFFFMSNQHIYAFGQLLIIKLGTLIG